MLRAMLLTGLSAMLLAGGTISADGPGQQVHWQKDLKSAHRVAIAEGKPILVVFGAEWCTYCHKLEKNVINQPETAAYINQNFVAVHLDADREKKIVGILEVDSLPCTVVLSPNADLLGRYEGYAETKKYTANLQRSAQAFRELQTAAATGGAVTR
ncbi:MAG: thioredoxin family protein [Planctomycetaceae bacterium]|nr:thioredoxin family protein [Planctomycetaceae bacterium]